MSSSTAKVLHVFDHSFPVSDGYAFRSREILRGLHRLGWQTVHVTSAKQGPAKAASETVDGLEFHRTSPSRNPLYRLPVANQWGIVATLRQRLEALMRIERPVLVHVHSPCLNGLAAIPVARKLDVPVIYEVRALWEDGAVDSGASREGDLRYRVSRMLETNIVKRADHVVTICEGLKREMLGRGLDAARVTVAPNSVNLDRFRNTPAFDAAQAAGMGLTAGKTIGFIGSFFAFEGLEILLRAVPAVLEQDPSVKILLVGDGPDANRLKAMADRLGIKKAVTFTGRVPNAEVEKFYGLMDILVYPRISSRVTELVTPLKPLEAMAQGKLVIASDVGGHREMVFPGENGLLFKAGDPRSLSQTCLQLLREPGNWEALRAKGRSYVTEARSWEKNARIYDDLYRSVLANARSGSTGRHCAQSSAN